ncbi:chloride channel protein [Chakrabartyella piscis]|uniref:chloride channel protein n=1 Tax=Chakrabartyella piscis TaxID=2918914 RepID=UPI002958A71C|nr:chloride channel protein [Chakrabartyella piscis]
MSDKELELLWYEMKNFAKDSPNVFGTCIKWILVGIVVGVLVGLVGVSFHWVLEEVTEIRMHHPQLIWGLPIGGLLIVGLYRLCGIHKDKGTNFILVAVRANEAVYLRRTPLIYISTVITHLFGGSAGREGAALQIGGSIASRLGRKIQLNEKDERIITMCGMAAGFAALFGTPITSVVFAMEVITVGIMHYSALVPCVISALVAVGLASWFGFAPTAFTLTGVPESITIQGTVSVGILAALCAVVSILFCVVMEKTSHAYKKRITNPWLQPVVGGCIVIILTFLVGTYDYNGAGMDVIQRAVAGEANPEAFLLKILFTALTLGAGYKGGEIVPSFFVGATFGCVMGNVLGLDPSFAAGLGMMAVFCGVTNCPLASLILCIELFGMEGLGYYALCCAISYMLSGYYGLYNEQKIMYSKVKPEFIDKNVV